MSLNPATAASDPDAPGILLLENYPAVGAAVTAALRKFAPRHVVRVAENFASTRKSAADFRPELVIIDLDPLPEGEIDLLLQLRARYPQARVVALAAGADAELRSLGASRVQFVEKPFELADFGAAIRTSLGIDPPPFGEIPDKIEALRMIDLLQLEHLARRSLILQTQTSLGNTGEVHLRRGEILHASAGSLRGPRALEAIARWPVEKILEEKLTENSPRTIDAPTRQLLAQLLRKMAEDEPAKSFGATVPSLGVEPSLGETRPSATSSLGESLGVAPPAPAVEPPKSVETKKILVIDDTEMLLVFVEDVLKALDPSFAIVTTASGRDGARLARELTPDLIVLDYCLGDIMGDEVCRELSAHAATARIPVLMMSGHLAELSRCAEQNRNIAATLPKPFLSGALIELTNKLLAQGPLAPPSDAASELVPAAPETATGFFVEPPLSNGTSHQPASENGLGGVAAAVETLPSEPAAPAPSLTNAVLPNDHPQDEVRAVLTFEVLSVQLTPDFRTGTLELKPLAATLDLRPESDCAQRSSALQTFHLGEVQLNADGQIEAIRFFPVGAAPADESPHAFAVAGVSAEADARGQSLQLTAAKNGRMHIELAAPFYLRETQLSPGFELSSIWLEPRDNVFEKPAELGASAAQFTVREVQLGAGAIMERLVVEAKRR